MTSPRNAGFTGLEVLFILVVFFIIIAIAATPSNLVKDFRLDQKPSEALVFEERVFDNTGSRDKANWNLSIKREIRTEYTFEDHDLKQLAASMNVAIAPVQAEIKARIEKEQIQIFRRIETKGESESLQIPVSPRTKRTVCLSWKDVWRTGHLKAAVGVQTIDVPFRLFQNRQFVGYSTSSCSARGE